MFRIPHNSIVLKNQSLGQLIFQARFDEEYGCSLQNPLQIPLDRQGPAARESQQMDDKSRVLLVIHRGR
jgi:hypothetical protein